MSHGLHTAGTGCCVNSGGAAPPPTHRQSTVSGMRGGGRAPGPPGCGSGSALITAPRPAASADASGAAWPCSSSAPPSSATSSSTSSSGPASRPAASRRPSAGSRPCGPALALVHPRPGAWALCGHGMRARRADSSARKRARARAPAPWRKHLRMLIRGITGQAAAARRGRTQIACGGRVPRAQAPGAPHRQLGRQGGAGGQRGAQQAQPLLQQRAAVAAGRAQHVREQRPEHAPDVPVGLAPRARVRQLPRPVRRARRRPETGRPCSVCDQVSVCCLR